MPDLKLELPKNIPDTDRAELLRALVSTNEERINEWGRRGEKKA